MAGPDAVLNVGANLIQGTKQAFTAIAKGFAAVSKGMSTQAKAMKAMGDAAGAVKFDKFANSMDKATGEIKEQITVLDKLGDGYEEAAAAGDKLSTSVKKQIDALKKAKQIQKSGAASGTVGGVDNSFADEMSVLKEKSKLINQLDGSYHKLINSTDAYGKKAQEVMGKLRAGEMGSVRAADEIASLEKRRNTYGKLAVELQKLTALYPKEAAAIAKTTNNYEKQVEQLRRLKKGRESLAAGDAQRLITQSKQGQQIADLNLKYNKLLTSESRYGKKARETQALLKQYPFLIKQAGDAYRYIAMEQQRALASMTPLQQATQRLGRSFKTYLSYMAASSAIFAVLQVFREATTTVIEYDQSLKDLQAITQSTDADVAAMGETIKQVASDTKFSAVETAEGMKLLGQSGLSAQESIDTIGAVANLATGTLTDMDTTVDLLTTSMRVFGIEAEDSARISDVWANAVNRSKLTIDKIRTAMNYIGPVAAAVGIEIEEVAGSMMIMANQGIRASTIGTGLRQVFRRLVDPSKEMSAAMAEAGLTMADFDPNVVGLQKVFDNLKLVVQDSGDAFRMFGQRGATAVLAITKGGGDALMGMLNIVQRTGTAADMAATQMEGLGVSFKNLQDKIKNLYIAMGENGLNGVLRTFVDTARSVVDILTGVFSNAWAQWIAKVLLATTAARGFIAALKWFVGLKGVTAIFTPWIAGMTAFSDASKGAAVSVGLLGRSLAAVRALFMTLWPAALLMGIVALVNHFAGANERIEEQVRKLRQHRNAVEENAFALQGFVSILKDYEGDLSSSSDVIQELLTKYPALSVEILAAVDDREKLVKILNKQIEAEQILANNDTFSLLEHGAREVADAMEDLYDAENSPIESFFKPDEMAKQGEAAKQVIKTKTGEMIREYSKLLEDRPMMTPDSFLFSGKTGDLKYAEQFAQHFKEQYAKVEALAKEKGLSTAQVFQKGFVDSFEDRKSDWETFNKAEETALAKKLYNLEQLRALDKISEEQLLDGINRATLESYDLRTRKAQEFHDKASDDGDIQATEFFYKKTEDRVKQSYSIRLKQLQEFGKQREKLEKELEQRTTQKDTSIQDYEKAITKDRKDQEKLRSDYTKTVGDKRKEIEKQVADKIKQINADLYKKLDDLRKERIAREKEAARDIESIGRSGDDKILSIRQRGMTDEQKEKSNAQAASKRYYDAEAAMAKAKKTRDLEDLATAQQLYESSSGYYESLEDAGQAESGVRRIINALQETRKLQLELQKEEIGKKELAAKDEAAGKIAELKKASVEELRVFKEAETEKLNIALEGIRTVAAERKKEHDIAMADHKAEIVLLKQKIEIEKARQQGSVGSLPPGEHVKLTDGGYQQTGFDQAQFTADLEKSIEAGAAGATPEISTYFSDAVEDGTTKGVKEGSKENTSKDTSIKEGVKQQVSEGVQEGIFDGVQVEGMSLEEWKAKGKAQGAALGGAVGDAVKEQLDFKMIEILDDEGQVVPVEVQITGVSEGGAEPLIEDIQATLDEYPGEPTLDFTVAEQMIESFVQDAERNYTISIPVKAVQANAEGGPVYAMAGGGRLPGHDSPKDKLNVLARPGEWFIKNESVKAWTSSVGDWFMRGVNAPGSAAGQRLQGLLDVNSTLSAQNRSISKLASNAGKQDSGMGEFGTINFQLASDEPAIPAMMRPVDAAELMRQLGKQGRLAA